MKGQFSLMKNSKINFIIHSVPRGKPLNLRGWVVWQTSYTQHKIRKGFNNIESY